MSKSTIIYHQVYQKFTEYDEQGNIVKEGSFRIPEWRQNILVNGPATIIWLEDGSKGVSQCHPNDNPKESTGRKLAYLRAKVISLGKEIKQVLKDTHKVN